MSATSALVPDSAKEALAKIVTDPALFSRLILQHDPWPVPEQIMRAIAKPHAQVAVKACHASSKTFTAAEIVLWFVTRYRDGIVVSTAPTQTQVRELLWSEVTKARDNARIKLPEPTLQELRIESGRYAIGRATNQGVRFQGFHGRVLVVIDEAPGVDSDIWDAIDGIRAGGDVRVLALGNPVVASGRFFEIFNEQRTGWETYTISAFDTPNLEGYTLDDVMRHQEGASWLAENERPYLTTRAWVRERHEILGGRNCDAHIQRTGSFCGALESAEFQSRVLGQFPQQSADALLSQSWLEAARKRECTPLVASEGYVAGIDVAGPGKAETTLYVRQGANVVHFDAWQSADPRGEVIQALRAFEHDLTVYVDEIGIGYNFMLHIRDVLAASYTAACKRAARYNEEMPVEPQVVGVNVGEAADDTERFANLKAELYWGIRQRFESGEVNGLVDPQTIAQLAGIRTRPNPRGQNTIEKKEDAAKRGVPSPDRAEGFMLCFSGATRPRALVLGSLTGASKW